MTGDPDLPGDVRDALVDVLTAAREAVRTGDAATARDRADVAARVVRARVPPGELRARLEHGFAAVERTAADEPLVASEYLRAMAELVEEGSGDEGDD